MISRIMKYGGISAKVRAMYGNRLTRSDYEKLVGTKTVADIAAYLKALPAWSEPLKGVQPSTVHRAELEKALHEGLALDYVRIYRFMSREDRPLMWFLIRFMEIDEISKVIRLLAAGEIPSYVCSLPSFFRVHATVRFDLLSKIQSFDDLLADIKNTIYYDALSALPRNQGAAPDYTLARSALVSRFYLDMLHRIDKSYSGDTADMLKDGAGVQIDLHNIQIIFRIKSFFPKMSQDALQYIIPYSNRIKPPFLRALADAPTVIDVYELLKSSPYAKLFTQNQFAHFEDYQTKYIYEFNKRLLSAAVPSIYTPIAYLNLKETEISNIINIIECVRYGETPRSASVYIPGM